MKKQVFALKDSNINPMFGDLISCTEYTFQMDLDWNSPVATDLDNKTIASVESKPFMTLPSNIYSEAPQLIISEEFTNSIVFEYQGML